MPRATTGARSATTANLARGEWQCSRVYAVLGRAEPALWHARRCVELDEAGAEGREDWDLAAAYEAMARAQHRRRRPGGAPSGRRKARTALATSPTPRTARSSSRTSPPSAVSGPRALRRRRPLDSCASTHDTRRRPSHDRPQDRHPALEPGRQPGPRCSTRPSASTGSATTTSGRGTTSTRSSATRTSRSSRAGPRSARGRWRPSGRASGCSSAPTRSAIPGSSPRPPRRSTTSAAAGPSSASAGRGWSSSTRPTASTSASGFGQRLDWLDESVAAMRGAARRRVR